MRVFRCASSSAILLLTVARGTFSCLAAAERLPASTTFSKIAIAPSLSTTYLPKFGNLASQKQGISLAIAIIFSGGVRNIQSHFGSGGGHEPEVCVSRDAPPNHDGRRRKNLLPRGRSKGRPDSLAVARLPDVLAHVPQSDPVPSGRLPRHRAGLSRVRPKRRAPLQVVFLYLREVW